MLSIAYYVKNVTERECKPCKRHKTSLEPNLPAISILVKIKYGSLASSETAEF